MRIASLVTLIAVAAGALAPATPARAAVATPPKLRLGDAVQPLRYAARLAVDPAQPTFKGSLELSLRVARPTDLVWLNATELTIERAHFLVGGTTVAARVVPGGADFVGFAVDQR